MNEPTHTQPMLTQKQAAERLHVGLWVLRELNLPRIQPSPRKPYMTPALSRRT